MRSLPGQTVGRRADHRAMVSQDRSRRASAKTNVIQIFGKSNRFGHFPIQKRFLGSGIAVRGHAVAFRRLPPVDSPGRMRAVRCMLGRGAACGRAMRHPQRPLPVRFRPFGCRQGRWPDRTVPQNPAPSSGCWPGQPASAPAIASLGSGPARSDPAPPRIRPALPIAAYPVCSDSCLGRIFPP